MKFTRCYDCRFRKKNLCMLNPPFLVMNSSGDLLMTSWPVVEGPDVKGITGCFRGKPAKSILARILEYFKI